MRSSTHWKCGLYVERRKQAVTENIGPLSLELQFRILCQQFYFTVRDRSYLEKMLLKENSTVQLDGVLCSFIFTCAMDDISFEGHY